MPGSFRYGRSCGSICLVGQSASVCRPQSLTPHSSLPAFHFDSLSQLDLQYTLQWMKFSDRWRRLAWRLQQPTYATWIGSTVITLAVMRTVVSSAGPADTRELHAATSGTDLCLLAVRLYLGFHVRMTRRDQTRYTCPSPFDGCRPGPRRCGRHVHAPQVCGGVRQPSVPVSESTAIE